MAEPDRTYTVITGVIHVHTTDSDGTKSHEEVADLARDVGLDFLLFADHMTLRGQHEGKERFYGDLLALIGYEHNDESDCNHYLVFDIDEVLPATMTAAQYVAAAADRGALGIMAHPDEIRGRDARFRSYPWTAWEVERFDGLEVWNQMSEWMENLKFYNQLVMIFSPRKWLQAPTHRILARWDELNQKRKVAGVASVDAHGFLYRAGPLRLTIFPYKVQFKTLRTHLVLHEPLSRDLTTAKKQVYDAIRDCRVFVSNYRWGEGHDFHFEITSRHESAVIGGEVALDDQTTAIVTCPVRGSIRIIADGKLLVEQAGKRLEYRLTRPGVYRVEVYRGRKGWIFSNPIWVVSR
jgi:hypothetical protein